MKDQKILLNTVPRATALCHQEEPVRRIVPFGASLALGGIASCRHYAGLHHVLSDVLMLPCYQGTNLAMMQAPCSFAWSIRSMIVSLDLNKLSPNHSFAISSIYQLPVEGGRPITLPHCAQKQGPQTDLMIPDWKWHSLQHGTNLHSCMAGFWLRL